MPVTSALSAKCVDEESFVCFIHFHTHYCIVVEWFVKLLRVLVMCSVSYYRDPMFAVGSDLLRLHADCVLPTDCCEWAFCPPE